MKKILRASALSCAAFCLALSLSTTSVQARDDNNQVVRTAQMRLTDLGYPVGDIDGVMGQSTEHALMNFQHHNGLQVTGQLTPETYALLTRQSQVGSGTALYQVYDNYYHTFAYEQPYTYANVIVDNPQVAWDDRWHYVRDQELPLRFARLNVREEDIGSMRQYVVTINGQPVLFADNQPGVLRASKTYSLPSEDAIIFTAYRGSADCPNKSYLLTVHSDGTFNQPYEIGNCAGSYQVNIADNTLFINFPGASLVDGLLTWNTWRYQNDFMTRI